MQLLITGGVVALILLLRVSRMTKARPLQIERLWVVPVIFAALTAVTFVQTPPSLSDAPWLVGIAAIAAIVGWYRGKMMRITVDPQTHALSQAASPVASLFLIAVLALRYGLRYVLGEEASAWGISLNLIADAPLVFIVVMFALQRVEMFIRASNLLAEARAAHTSTPITAEPGKS